LASFPVDNASVQPLTIGEAIPLYLLDMSDESDCPSGLLVTHLGMNACIILYFTSTRHSNLFADVLWSWK
jgi:hypothetical protein